MSARRDFRTACLGCLHDMHSDEPYDEVAQCDRCGEPLSTLYLPVDASQWVAMARRAIYKDVLKKKDASYVAHSLATVTVQGFPLELLENFMEEATAAGREGPNDFDKEAPRTQWRRLDKKQSWLLTTVSSVAFLCGFHHLLLPEDNGSAWDNCRQVATGDILCACPPFEVWASQAEVMKDTLVNTVQFRFSTAIIPNRANTYVRFSGQHPVCTTPEGADIRRWPHLPFYSDYQQYLRWRLGVLVRGNRRRLVAAGKKNLLDSIALPSWKAAGPPEVVPDRLPSDTYSEDDQAVPWQHPKLTSKMAAFKTSGDAVRLREASARDAAAAAQAAELYEARKKAEYERWCYQEGKRMTLALLAIPGREADLAGRTYNYSKERDPRFNGEHAAAGYEGVGPDPCDPSNRRSWLMNFPKTWRLHEKEEAAARERQKRLDRKRRLGR